MTTDSIDQTAPAVPAPVAPGIPETVARLRATFATGRTRSIEWRKQQLKAIEKMMTENEGAIIEALAADHGRGPFESWMTDVAPSLPRPGRPPRACAGGCGADTACSSCRSCPVAAGWSTSRTAPC
jgi:hypothetical protein